MLVSLKAKNCFLFDEEIALSMKADAHIKRFADNVAVVGGMNLLKFAIVLGPNNAGKTRFTECVKAIKNIMLNRTVKLILMSNFFTDSSVCELTVCFVYNELPYTFEVHYDTEVDEFVYERLSAIEKTGNAHDLYVRDTVNDIYDCSDDDKLAALLPHISRDNILIYLLDSAKFEVLRQAKRVITGFASSIDVVDMNDISLSRTIDRMKNTQSASRIREFVLNADLSLNDFRFDENLSHIPALKKDMPKDLSEVMRFNKDLLSLASVYGDTVAVPSILFDSRGTLAIEAIAAYVIDALEQGNVLVIDELDNSLHFRLTRAIVSLFNNELNTSAQLIATTHDPTLLDCKKLFRKEQIWFAHKDESGVYLYSLADFTAQEHGVRADTSNLLAKYKAGVFGALPDPDLFSVLQGLDHEE